MAGMKTIPSFFNATLLLI